MKFACRALIFSALIILIFCSNYAESSSLKFETGGASSNASILACYYRNHIINDTLLPANVCTHIIFAFGVVTLNGIVPEHPTDPLTFRTLAKLKEKNPKLKVMISVQKGFPTVVSGGTEAMLRFSLSALTFLQKYNFDGLDLDWEFPNILQRHPFSQFIMILSTVLHWSNKLLSLALPNSIGGFEQGYYPDTLNKYADFMTVMTYDFHAYSKRDHLTGFNSPLFSLKGEDPFQSTAGALDYLLFRGVSPKKMLIGFPTYGRTWELANASVHGVHAPAIGLGHPGPVTNITGYYLLQDVCVAQKKGGVVVRDEQAGAEYMVYNKTWIAFNGMYSAKIKTDWLKRKHLAGVGVWTFEDDDPKDVCSLGHFPVLSKIRSYLS